MAKSSVSAAPALVKEIRTALEARADEKARLSIAAAQPKSPLKTLGVRASFIKAIAKETLAKARPMTDYATAVALVEAAVVRKVREEILVALEILERFRRDFEPGLFSRLEKWIGVTDDLEIAEAMGTRVAAPLVASDPSRMASVKKWAKLKSPGRRRLAVLAAAGLVTDGRREAALALELCELLLHEDSPLLVSAVASLLRDTTKVDAKAVQDFLFRRSVDGNPDILRAGSENLDAARRAALIAKLEAQAAVGTPLAAAETR
jgi:3-methyladenine DNA glycosylase AlkD